jgi:hypothetical protein
VQAVGTNQTDVRSPFPQLPTVLNTKVGDGKLKFTWATKTLVQVERGAKAELPLWLGETLHKHNLATVHRPNFLGEKCVAHSFQAPRFVTTTGFKRENCVAGSSGA